MHRKKALGAWRRERLLYLGIEGKYLTDTLGLVWKTKTAWGCGHRDCVYVASSCISRAQQKG